MLLQNVLKYVLILSSLFFFFLFPWFTVKLSFLMTFLSKGRKLVSFHRVFKIHALLVLLFRTPHTLMKWKEGAYISKYNEIAHVLPYLWSSLASLLLCIIRNKAAELQLYLKAYMQTLARFAWKQWVFSSGGPTRKKHPPHSWGRHVRKMLLKDLCLMGDLNLLCNFSSSMQNVT